MAEMLSAAVWDDDGVRTGKGVSLYVIGHDKFYMEYCDIDAMSLVLAKYGEKVLGWDGRHILDVLLILDDGAEFFTKWKFCRYINSRKEVSYGCVLTACDEVENPYKVVLPEPVVSRNFKEFKERITA